MEDKEEHRYASKSPAPRINMREKLSERSQRYRGPDGLCYFNVGRVKPGGRPPNPPVDQAVDEPRNIILCLQSSQTFLAWQDFHDLKHP